MNPKFQRSTGIPNAEWPFVRGLIFECKRRSDNFPEIEDNKIDIGSVTRKVARKYFTLAQPENVMKLSLVFSIKAIASVATVAFWTLSLHAQTAAPRAIRVTAIGGTASYSHAGGAFMPLTVGAKLGKGDVIKSGQGSHVDLDMGKNVGVVQVAPNSNFSIDESTATQTGTEVLTETQLSLSAGSIYAKINKLPKGSRFEITTPKGIAGLRGSAAAFFCSASGQLTMEEGEAGIAFGANDVELVHEGETVGPNDRPTHPTSGQSLRDIVEALRDAATHGLGQSIKSYVVSPPEPFISTVLPDSRALKSAEQTPRD